LSLVVDRTYGEQSQRIPGYVLHDDDDVTANGERRHTDKGVGLAIGDRGFDPSRCAVKCDLGQVVHTHLPLSQSGIVWYRRKLEE